ncbi:MAG: hypothetical protein QME96_11995, partial [Myxococcota bacterium]|nr:hypothetical protein [Myxococcota bacterium]
MDGLQEKLPIFDDGDKPRMVWLLELHEHSQGGLTGVAALLYGEQVQPSTAAEIESLLRKVERARGGDLLDSQEVRHGGGRGRRGCGTSLQGH